MLPSLTLGAFELSLWEVAQGYSTIGRMGQGDHIHTVTRVEGHDGEVIFERVPATSIELPPQPTAALVGMLRQTLEVGTGRAARAWGLVGDYAGKTGTTNDTKDAWMAGFSARLLTVVWVGYDDNTPMGLTGASAALPIWTEIAKAEQADFLTPTFAWPKGAEPRQFTRDQLIEKFPSLKDLLPEQVELVFADWAY